jgi:hypothetical protein
VDRKQGARRSNAALALLPRPASKVHSDPSHIVELDTHNFKLPPSSALRVLADEAPAAKGPSTVPKFYSCLVAASRDSINSGFLHRSPRVVRLGLSTPSAGFG